MKKLSSICLITVLAALSWAVALAAAHVLRQRPVELAIDFLSEPTAPIEAGILDPQTGSFHPAGPADAIDESYAPHHYQFAVSVSETSGPVELLFNGNPDRMEFSPKEAWANNGTYINHIKPKLPGRVDFEGWHWGPSPRLTFTRDPSLNNATVHFGDASQTLELKADTMAQVDDEGALQIPVQTNRRLYRYHARMANPEPQRLALRGRDGHPLPEVHRLYINSVFPSVFETSAAAPHEPSAWFHQNWTPQFAEDGALLLPSGIDSTQLTAILFVTIFVCLLSGFFLYRLLWAAAADTSAPTLRPFSAKRLFVYWGLLFLVWAMFLVIFWPGTMNVDSLQQWKQAHEFKFDTQHPVLYALFFWAITRLWDSPAPLVLLQIVALSGLLAWGFCLLDRARVSRWILWPAFVITALSPKNATMVISLIKDTPYAIAMVTLIVVSLHLLLDPPEQKRLRLWMVVALSLALLPLLRHNGLLITMGMAVLLPLVFAGARRHAVVACAAAIAVWAGVGLGLLPNLPTEDKVVNSKFIIGHMAIFLDRDVPLSNGDYHFLNSVRPIADRWNYSKGRIDGTTDPVGIKLNDETLEQQTPEILKKYLDLVKRNPILAVTYFLERGEYIYIPWVTGPIETYFLGISRNNLGLSNLELILDWPDTISRHLAATTKPALNWLLWRPALPFYVCLIAMVVLLARRKPRRAVVLFAPLWLGTLSLLVIPIAQTARYQFYFTLPTALLLACAFLPSATEAQPASPSAQEVDHET